jgi:hypothetical protein
MHARLEELISLRDREPVDAALPAHVAACPECARALRALAQVQAGLRALPAAEAPAGGWERIAALHAAGPRVQPAAALPVAGGAPARAPGTAARWAGAAAVAALALVLVASPWWLRTDQQQGAVVPIEALVARSQQLEAALHDLPERPAVEMAASSAAIDALQSRIQWVDEVLANQPRLEPAHAQALWQSRVRLLDSLVGVRYAEAVRAGYPMKAEDQSTGGT